MNAPGILCAGRFCFQKRPLVETQAVEISDKQRISIICISFVTGGLDTPLRGYSTNGLLWLLEADYGC